MKTCSSCKKEFPLDCFSNYKRTSDGKQSYCKTCATNKQREYYEKNSERLIAERINWRNKSEENREKDREASRRWTELHPELYKKHWKGYNYRKRLRVLQKVSGVEVPKCVWCGCDVVLFLEVNHKNGGGSKEVKGENSKFCQKILKGERGLDDLEVLCKPCNNLHYLELKYGKQPYKIIWEGSKDNVQSVNMDRCPPTSS